MMDLRYHHFLLRYTSYHSKIKIKSKYLDHIQWFSCPWSYLINIVITELELPVKHHFSLSMHLHRKKLWLEYHQKLDEKPNFSTKVSQMTSPQMSKIFLVICD